MDHQNYAVFIDLENAGGKVSMLTSIIEKVKMRGDILLGKVYGYTEAYSELKEVLLSNTFQVVPSIRWGYNQKNNLDIQLVIDALDVAYKNELIDCFCIVSGDSDYTPLVGKLKSMGKFVLGLSRSEVASGIFISACNEFVFLETVTQPKKKRVSAAPEETTGRDNLPEIHKLILQVLNEQADPDVQIHASELKNILLRLRPDFNERDFGYSSFGKLLYALEEKFHGIRIASDGFALKIGLSPEAQSAEPTRKITKDNWTEIFTSTLSRFKDEGFNRVNASIFKAAITNDYPDFEERQIGYKKFSDVLKKLERDKILTLETNEQNAMLIHIH